MATKVARLEATLGFADQEFTDGIRRAERHADSFAGRFEKRFEGLFRKSPGRKAELAVSNLVGDLVSGNVSGAITNFGARISGLGLGIGLAIGAGIEVFEKLHEHVKMVEHDTEALREEMSKPFDVIAGLSPDAIGQQAEQVKQKYDQIVEDHKGFTHTITNLIKDTFTGGLTEQAQYGSSGMEDATLEKQGFLEFARRKKEQGRSELELANSRKSSAGDSTQTALNELYFNSRSKENQIKLEALHVPGAAAGAADRLKALKTDEERMTDEIMHRSELRDKEFGLAQKIANLERSGLPEMKRKQVGAALGLEAVQNALSDPNTTKDERSALQLEKTKRENELRDLTKGTRNPFSAGTIAARDWEEKNNPSFGSIQARTNEMNDPSAFGSIANSAANRGEIPQGETESAEVPALLKTLIDLTAAAWAK